jgi:hypothetical protein
MSQLKKIISYYFEHCIVFLTNYELQLCLDAIEDVDLESVGARDNLFVANFTASCAVE